MAVIIGIDLGTSNSAAAVLRGGRPVLIPSAEGVSLGGKAFPSYVAITADGEHLLYADGNGNVYRRNIWNDGIDAIFPASGTAIVAATAGESLFIDDTFYLANHPVARFPGASGGALNGRGDRLLVRADDRLWLVSGLPPGAGPNLPPAHLEQLVTLRRLRSEGAISQNDFLQTLKQLLGHP